MIASFLHFINGLFKMGPLVVLWILILVCVNAIIPSIFLPDFVATITIIIFFVGATAMIILTHYYGFTRILGLVHILWIPLLAFLLTKIDLANLSSPYHQWLAGLIACNAVSLVIDIIDVYRYVKGDRNELVNFSGS